MMSYQRQPRARAEHRLSFVGLDGRTYEADLSTSIKSRHIWYGHEDVSPHEILLRTAAGRWVLLVNMPLELVEDGSGSPAPRELTRQQAAEWCWLNRVPLPVELADYDHVVSAKPPGGSSDRGEPLAAAPQGPGAVPPPPVPEAAAGQATAGNKTPLQADPADSAKTAKGTPCTPERRNGQALTDAEKSVYERVIRAANRLKLTPRMLGNLAKIAAAAKVDDIDVVRKALKWDASRRRRRR